MFATLSTRTVALSGNPTPLLHLDISHLHNHPHSPSAAVRRPRPPLRRLRSPAPPSSDPRRHLLPSVHVPARLHGAPTCVALPESVFKRYLFLYQGLLPFLVACGSPEATAWVTTRQLPTAAACLLAWGVSGWLWSPLWLCGVCRHHRLGACDSGPADQEV
jgi:hypothetical protein